MGGDGGWGGGVGWVGRGCRVGGEESYSPRLCTTEYFHINFIQYYNTFWNVSSQFY